MGRFAKNIFMPRRSHSLTVREQTTKRVREEANAGGLSVDKLINELVGWKK
jgi:hypothetical protein